jgi:hypothetical protein
LADIKTNLRELSVGFYFYQGKTGVPLTPSYFLQACQNNIIGCNSLTIQNISSRTDSFTSNELQIIYNGLKLGEVIRRIFKINITPKIQWVGFHTQSGEAVDLKINDIPFSLKEESFILENMGLYKLMNIIMDKEKYKRGLHVFEAFAPDELNDWFETTKRLLLKFGPIPFLIKDRRYRSLANLDKNNTLILEFEGMMKKGASTIVDFPNCDYHRFEHSTTSLTREKVFAKWLQAIVGNKPEYLDSKRKCAVAAGQRIEQELQPYINTSPISLLRLYRDEEYFYAKTTAYKVEIYHVPSKSKCTIPLIIKDIKAKVPQHQLNIHTLIENENTHQTVEFRSELRYSHGQFNGTPEAKFYIASGEMVALYEKLYPN